MTSAVHDSVRLVCADYLELADHHTPGLVEGLYLQGSVALGDYRAGVSDIDFVAVTRTTPDAATLAAIHHQLRRRHRRPAFDGLYVSWDDLRRDPAQVPAGPAVHDGRVQSASRSDRHPVTWHILAQAGVAVRGPAVADLGIHTDHAALAEATAANLVDYWVPWLDRGARSLIGLTPWAVTWGVLGVARLRHTLAAGRVTTKTEAAAFALEAYDRCWHRVIREALRIRVGGARLYRSPWHRRADLVGFLTQALDR